MSNTLQDAIDSLLEARDDTGFEDGERVPVFFVTPDGAKYRLGMFEACDVDTDDPRVVFGLVPFVGKPLEKES